MHLVVTGFPDWVLQALCWTLIHSLWQGLIAAVLAALIISFTRRSSAALRYNLLLAVLLLFVLGTGITAMRLLHSTGELQKTVAAAGSKVGSSFAVNLHAKPVLVDRVTAQGNWVEWFSAFCNKQASLIVLVWFIFFLIKCCQMATGLHYIHRIRHRNNFEVSPQWKQRLSELAKKTAISRNILFLESEMISVPAVIGFLKPVLLVPAGLLTNLPVEQVEAILLHELAHIHRADFLINLMQSVIEAFFFFNPGVVWISSLIAQEREACCDDLVIASIPQKTSYLQALTSFQELHLYPKPAAMALTRNKYYLLDRVKRMLTLENKNLNFMEKTVLLLSILGITAFSFIAAQRKEDAAQVAVVKKQTFELPKNPWPTTVPLHETKKPANNQKKAALLTSSKLHVDTIPKPNTGQGGERSFPSISSNTSNDGDHVVSQVYATDNEGKHYSIKRVDGQITGLSVDGKPIAQNQYGQYDDVIRQIDESQQQRFLKRKQELELKKADFMVKQKQMQEKREQLAMASAKQRSQQIELKKQMQIQLKMKENRRFLEEKKTEMLQRRKFDQKKAEFIKKEKLFGPETRSNNDISRIISDLRDQNLVSDENNLSFTLTSNELIVNGKRQPSDIHQHFKDRYIQNSADRFTYSKKGNTTSITINKE